MFISPLNLFAYRPKGEGKLISTDPTLILLNKKKNALINQLHYLRSKFPTFIDSNYNLDKTKKTKFEEEERKNLIYLLVYHNFIKFARKRIVEINNLLGKETSDEQKTFLEENKKKIKDLIKKYNQIFGSSLSKKTLETSLSDELTILTAYVLFNYPFEEEFDRPEEIWEKLVKKSKESRERKNNEIFSTATAEFSKLIRELKKEMERLGIDGDEEAKKRLEEVENNLKNKVLDKFKPSELEPAITNGGGWISFFFSKFEVLDYANETNSRSIEFTVLPDKEPKLVLDEFDEEDRDFIQGIINYEELKKVKVFFNETIIETFKNFEKLLEKLLKVEQGKFEIEIKQIFIKDKFFNPEPNLASIKFENETLLVGSPLVDNNCGVEANIILEEEKKEEEISNWWQVSYFIGGRLEDEVHAAIPENESLMEYWESKGFTPKSYLEWIQAIFGKSDTTLTTIREMRDGAYECEFIDWIRNNKADTIDDLSKLSSEMHKVEPNKNLLLELRKEFMIYAIRRRIDTWGEKMNLDEFEDAFNANGQNWSEGSWGREETWVDLINEIDCFEIRETIEGEHEGTRTYLDTVQTVLARLWETLAITWNRFLNRINYKDIVKNPGDTIEKDTIFNFMKSCWIKGEPNIWGGEDEWLLPSALCEKAITEMNSDSFSVGFDNNLTLYQNILKFEVPSETIL